MWDYLAIEFNYLYPKVFFEALKLAGKQGWELVTIYKDVAYLKKNIVDVDKFKASVRKAVKNETPQPAKKTI